MSRFTVIDCEQRSDEWRRARAGRATGSRAADYRAKIKSGEAAGRRNYRTQLVTERLTGMPLDPSFMSGSMKQGQIREPDAVGAYEALTGNLVISTGFISLNEIMAGCSLDGHLGKFETLLSIKCPLPATHVTCWRESRLPPDYALQATHELWVTGASKYQFCSYCPAFPEELQLFLVEADRSEFDIALHERETLQFLKEVDAEVVMLRNAKNPWVMCEIASDQDAKRHST